MGSGADRCVLATAVRRPLRRSVAEWNTATVIWLSTPLTPETPQAYSVVGCLCVALEISPRSVTLSYFMSLRIPLLLHSRRLSARHHLCHMATRLDPLEKNVTSVPTP